MKKFRFVILILSLTCIARATRIQAATKLHAYAISDISVLNGKKQPVASIKKGTTFRYLEECGSYIKLKYEGKTRYALSGNLVLNSGFDNFVKQHRNLFDTKLRANVGLPVYKNQKMKGVLRRVPKNTEFCSFGEYGQFYKVQLDGKFGYVEQKLCQKFCMLEVTEFPAIEGNAPGERIVNFAKKFIGNPYVWGGISLTAGCDCSGFVQSVYKRFGYSLPRCSYQQAEVGKEVAFKD